MLRDWLRPVSVSAYVRSGSAVFPVGQTCVKFGSSAGQSRVKFTLKCARQVRVKFRSCAGQFCVRMCGYISGRVRVKFALKCAGQVLVEFRSMFVYTCGDPAYYVLTAVWIDHTQPNDSRVDVQASEFFLGRKLIWKPRKLSIILVVVDLI